MWAWRKWQIVMMLTLAAVTKQAPLLSKQLLLADALFATTATPQRRRSACAFSGPPLLPRSRRVVPITDHSAILARRGLLTQSEESEFAARLSSSCLGSRVFRPVSCRRGHGFLSAVRGQGDADASHFFASLTPNRPSGVPACVGASANQKHSLATAKFLNCLQRLLREFKNRNSIWYCSFTRDADALRLSSSLFSQGAPSEARGSGSTDQ